MMPIRTLNTGLGCLISAASLFLGLMFATAGGAIYPPIVGPGAHLLCPAPSTVDYESHGASYRPGEYTVTRQIYCVSADGQAREEITFKAIGVAFIVYTAIVFALLRFVAVPLLRRRWRAAMARAGIDVDAMAREAPARFVVRGTEPPPGNDAAARLAELKRLRDAGLITEADYDAKKADILAGL